MGNTWSDIFYPGNPERRRKVTQLATRLFTIMENNFSALNDIINLLNKHTKLDRKLQRIYVNHDATIKENADLFSERAEEVQKCVAVIDAKLAEKLDPKLYREVKSPNIHFGERMQRVNKIFSATVSVIATVVGIAVVAAIAGGFILGGVVAVIGVLGASVVAGVAIGVFFLGVDMIAGAIIGAQERDQLEKTIDQLEDVIEDFEPKSKKFQKQVLQVLVYLEDEL